MERLKLNKEYPDDSGKAYKVIASWVFLVIAGRLLPHPANVTPLLSFAWLLGSYVSYRNSLLLVMLSLLITDAMLAYLHNHSWLGNWSWFTYSGIIALAGSRYLLPALSRYQIILLMPVISGSYWLWTNLGVWYSGSLYPLTMTGFLACYTAALPFLTSALPGDLVWLLVLLSSDRIITGRKTARYSTLV